jgi:NADPH:quinone reductase-like Zn-dependent oxidoreductase
VKAIVNQRYGSPDGLELREVDVPEIGEDEVLVRVRAASVNPYDWHMMRGHPYFVRLMTGVRRPSAPGLGADMAGVVEAVGPSVTRLQPGDEVFGAGEGSFAELAKATEARLAPKPSRLSFEQAAAVPIAGCTALQAVRDRGGVREGQRVVVNGAAGGIGTFAVQIGSKLGAEVTGVCSTRNVELVRSLGADRVVDYTRDDFTRDGPYDVILDTVGNRSLRALRRALTPTGTLVAVGGGTGRLLGGLGSALGLSVLSRFVDQRLLWFLARVRERDLTWVAEAVTPVVDRTYPLADTAEALRYVETGHARGKVVIAV